MATAMLAGCGGSQPLISAPGTMPQAAALASRTTSTNYKVVYSFGAYPDGAEPLAPLINVNGTLFGTTQYGIKIFRYAPRCTAMADAMLCSRRPESRSPLDDSL